MISKETYETVMANAEVLDSAVVYSRDFNYNLYVCRNLRGNESLTSYLVLVSKH